MTESIKYSSKQIRDLVEELVLHKKSEESLGIEESQKNKLKNVFSDRDLLKAISNIQDPSYISSIDYKDFCFIEETLRVNTDYLTYLKEEVDQEIFLKEGYKLDEEKLKDMWNKNSRVKKQFPNLNFKRISELYRNPPKELGVDYDDKLKIIVDIFVFRKYILAMIQMIFNKMDLVVIISGSEGSGKSTKVTQDMRILYYILIEIGVIDYAFDIKEMMFSKLSDLRTAEDKYFFNPFRIFCLDEGNELNRQNWREPEVQTFIQRLRRERHNQRIKFINLPVLGELPMNIVVTRVNFIFDMQMDNDLKTGTLRKGIVDFYIVPRGKYIYSPFHKKNLSRFEIKNTLYENLKDKAYLKGIPKAILIKKFKANGVWGFKEELYIKNLKDTNETFTVEKGITFGEVELFMFYKTLVTAIKQGLKSRDPRYASFSKMISRINNYFEKDLDRLNKYEAMYKRKEEKFNEEYGH